MVWRPNWRKNSWGSCSRGTEGCLLKRLQVNEPPSPQINIPESLGYEKAGRHPSLAYPIDPYPSIGEWGSQDT